MLFSAMLHGEPQLLRLLRAPRVLEPYMCDLSGCGLAGLLVRPADRPAESPAVMINRLIYYKLETQAVDTACVEIKYLSSYYRGLCRAAGGAGDKPMFSFCRTNYFRVLLHRTPGRIHSHGSIPATPGSRRSIHATAVSGYSPISFICTPAPDQRLRL